ncbi:MAG: recombinase family protein [Acidobacteriota bacterium]|nr:recombinase family protein [Acidobacteriota bacterium]
MLQKAKSGLYPSSAAAGYRNVEGPDQKRIIVPNGDAPTIARLFEEFATGQYSLKTLAAYARKEGLTVGSRPLHKSTLHQILRKRIYTGEFDWNGVKYAGTHEALVSRNTWERVPTLFDHRMQTKQRRVKHDFAFTGFIQCGTVAAIWWANLRNNGTFTTTSPATAENAQSRTPEKRRCRTSLLLRSGNS